MAEEPKTISAEPSSGEIHEIVWVAERPRTRALSALPRVGRKQPATNRSQFTSNRREHPCGREFRRTVRDAQARRPSLRSKFSALRGDRSDRRSVVEAHHKGRATL